MSESIASLRLLRRKIAALERQKPAISTGSVRTGYEPLDLALAGGLQRGRLHELFALDAADGSSAAGFAAMLAHGLGGGIVWLREEKAQRQAGSLRADGLLELGVDPERLILAILPDARAVLRAAADVVRCPEVGAAVIELWRNPPLLDLTASRRLALAAEESGVTALLLRIAASPAPSAAQTRWAVRSTASAPLETNAPGHPAFELTLLRQRGRPAERSWLVEWNRDQAIFQALRGDAAASGAVDAVSADRPPSSNVVPLRRTG